MPQLNNRNLPVGLSSRDAASGFEEREILYKLLFDMKNDLNDLKSLVFELIKSNNLQMPNIPAGKLTLPGNAPGIQRGSYTQTPDYFQADAVESGFSTPAQPFYYDRTNPGEFHDNVEIVDENLNMNHIEKDAIVKALKKHNGRRREAADDLGMSERTLYRKIKQYGIEN